MEHTSRELCEKYTSLDQKQIAEVLTWLKDIQKIADSEECNVYIDCMTFYGTSFVVVAEAKPTNRQQLYEKPIIGSIIKSYREPAVERAYTSGQPTVGVLGLEMPTTKKVVQSAYPIFYQDEVIAVLIYEKVLEAYQSQQWEKAEEILLTPELISFLEALQDAALVTDRNGRISYANASAKTLFQELGYIDSLEGMEIENIVSFGNEKYQTFQMSGHYFKAKKLLVDPKQSVEGILIHDITELERAKKSMKKLRLSNVELQHSTKNGLQLLEFADQKCLDQAENESVKAALQAEIGRLRALRTITEIKLENEEAGMQTMLQQLAEEIVSMLRNPDTEIRVKVEGDDFRLQGDTVNAVILIIYELLCNALKYAFKDRKEGTITIRLADEDILYTFQVQDDGCGFTVSEDTWNASVGLGMIRTLVKERLNGNLKIQSDQNGTSVTFDVIE